MTILPYFLADLALCVPNIVFFGLAAACPTRQLAAQCALEALGAGYFIDLTRDGGGGELQRMSCSGAEGPQQVQLFNFTEQEERERDRSQKAQREGERRERWGRG